MHQIYSCSDENLEVFTVISSKYHRIEHWFLNTLLFLATTLQACSPVRRKAKSSQCSLSKKVVTASDFNPHRTEELLSHPGDLFQVFCKDENRQQGFCSYPANCSPTHTGVSKRFSSHINHQSDASCLQPQASPVSHHSTKWRAATPPTMRNGVFAREQGRLSRKNTEDDLSQAQGSEASSPLTGSTLYGTPSLLRKIWMKHKKKSEYLGATNSAFEAD